MKQKDIQLGLAGQRRFYRILSFLVPFAAMLICFTMLGMYPFGNKGPAMLGDAVAEYFPHLILMRRILLRGESLLYTWRVGFGAPVVSDVLASFCTSPINLLGFLLPEDLYARYLCFGTCVRFGLTSYFLAILLQQISGKAEASVPAFCSAYAMNLWMLTNYWQITMMDVVVFTPMVLLGLLKLVRDRDMRLYPLMLGLSIFMSSYMSIFTAIICGFFWIGLLLMYDRSWREVPREILRFLGYSILGACFSAIIVLPSVVSISATSNLSRIEFHWTEFYADFITMAGQLATGVWPRINAHPANAASSILLVLTIMGFLTAPKLRLRERIYTFFVAAFIFASFCYSPLNLIWHGLHYPFVTVQRFSYMLPLVLAYMGWRFTANLHPEPLPEDAPTGKKVGRGFYALMQFVLMGAAAAGVCWCAQKKDLTDIVLLPLGVAGVLLLFYVIYRFFPKTALLFHVGVFVIVSLEVTFGAWLTLTRNTNTIAGGKIAIEKNDIVEKGLEAVAEDAGDANFYRSGLLYEMVNKELLYDGVIGGSSTFSSVIPTEFKRMGGMLGLDAREINQQYYQIQPLMPLSTLLFDMQYLVSAAPALDQLMLYEPLNGDNETATAYKFAYPTALGFMIPENVTLDELPDTGVMDVQAALTERLTGVTESVFDATDVTLKIDEDFLNDAEVELKDNQGFSIKAAHDESSLSGRDDLNTADLDEDDFADVLHPHVRVTLEVPEDGKYWLDLTHDEELSAGTKRYSIEVDKIAVKAGELALNNLTVVLPESLMQPLGELKAGTKIDLTYYVIPDAEGSVNLQLLKFNENCFDAVYEKLMHSPFTVTEFDSDTITGTVTTENNALLYLSIPYRNGWTAYVDGVETSIVPVLDAMSGIQLMSGTHTVRLEYHQPMLAEGAIASGAALLIYLLFAVIQQTKRRIARKRGFIEDAPLPEENDPPKAEKKESAPKKPEPTEPEAESAQQPEIPVQPSEPAVKPQTPAPAAEKPAAPRSSNAPRRGFYEKHKPQHLTPEDQAEARFVKGAHFAGSDEDDDADD